MLFLGGGRQRDVAAVVRALENDEVDSRVRALPGLMQRVADRRDGACRLVAVDRRKRAAEVAVPKAVVDIHLDRTPTEDEIAGRLLRLGALARSQSVAVAMGEPYPHTIRELKSWLAAQPPERLRLVPLSAVADRQIIQ